MKRSEMLRVTLLLLVGAVVWTTADGHQAGDTTGKRVPKQIHGKGASLVDTSEDHRAAETGFGAAGVGGHGKFFQYQHNPEHDHYEFGYRRGNDHHFQERYEKAHPHEGQFKTKVRWGDKHGGYGEHYWDYNHAGHGDGGDDGGDGGYSEPVPKYQQAPAVNQRQRLLDIEGLSPPGHRVARTPKPAPAPASQFTYDPNTGRIVDETTGQLYDLQPVLN